MNKIKKIFSSKLMVLLASTFFGGMVLVSSSFAWGPERPTYTNDSPASYATFNSITDNAAVGDERNFVRVGEVGSSDPYTDTIEVEPGKEYEVYIYYHNNAASNTNSTGYGMATNTKVASAYPTILNVNEQGMVSGVISWSYVNPSDDSINTGTVWDEAYLTTKTSGVVLRYKTGSAIIHNAGAANGSVLPTNLFTEEGTPIGYNKLAGTIPGCAEYSGYITYTLVAEKVDSSLEKQVSLDGENWTDNITAKPGQYLTYKITFYNTGNTDLANVILKDEHDDGLILRKGSTYIYDVNNVEGKNIDDIIDLSGYNTGDAAPGALKQAIYQMQVGTDDSLCGKTLNNKILLNFNSAEQGEDNTTVTVSCDPPTKEDCTTNPELEGCTTPEDTPEKNCKTNPEMEGCQELPNTGPLEIVLAIVIIIGIGGGGYYLYRTQKTLKTVEDSVSGKDAAKDSTDTSSQKPNDMV